MHESFKLISFPQIRSFGDIKIHIDCENELREIERDYCNKEKFLSDLRARLNYLNEKREEAVFHREWFEKLKHAEKLYSMHMAKINNTRVLYCFYERKIYLLCAFCEKSRGKRDSYPQFIEIAEKRYSDIFKEA